MGWGHIFEFLGGFAMMYFGWVGLSGTAKKAMRAPEGAIMWLFGLVLTGAATVGGGLIAYNTGEQAYRDQLYKEELRERIVKNHEVAVANYIRVQDQYDAMSAALKAKHAAALARAKAQAERGTEKDLQIVDDYTADSIRQYGLENVEVLEKEITVASMKQAVERMLK